MRGIVVNMGLVALAAGLAWAQAPLQLPVGTSVRIQLAGSVDTTLDGTVQRSTEGCTLILFERNPSTSRPTVASLAGIARIWVSAQRPGTPWQLYSMERLRSAEPPQCLGRTRLQPVPK